MIPYMYMHPGTTEVAIDVLDKCTVRRSQGDCDVVYNFEFLEPFKEKGWEGALFQSFVAAGMIAMFIMIQFIVHWSWNKWG